MKEKIPQPAPVSRTLQEKARESKPASVADVLQAYKNGIVQQQAVDEEDELLQGKFETAQRDELEDDELLQGKFETAQRDELEDDELLQGKFETVQREELEDDELLQGKFEITQRKETPNNTGMSDNLKAGVEQLSGLDMSDVKVHYNSSKPAGVQAYAYTQGTDIHVAPGQEKHLGHEAWHVAQQKQGRVQPTTTVGGMAVNDNTGLEKEADVMGGKAVQMKLGENRSWAVGNDVGQRKSDVKQCFGFLDNRPEIVAQKKCHEISDNILNVRQLCSICKKTVNVAQLMQIQVGFDDSLTQSMFGGPGDNLKTTGLASCIAIVAYHKVIPSLGAVMRHYDSAQASTETVYDSLSKKITFTFDSAKIGVVAQATADELVAHVPTAEGNIGFAVALGAIWKTDKVSRLNLINAIEAGVGVQPSIESNTANFDVATSTLS